MPHPCDGCTAQAVDHAIICPVLGVMANGRHRSIQSATPQVAFDRLHGWAASRNSRHTIALRSEYWRSDFESWDTTHEATRADSYPYASNGLWIRQRRKRIDRGANKGGRLTAPSLRLGLATSALATIDV